MSRTINNSDLIGSYSSTEASKISEEMGRRVKMAEFLTDLDKVCKKHKMPKVDSEEFKKLSFKGINP